MEVNYYNTGTSGRNTYKYTDTAGQNFLDYVGRAESSVGQAGNYANTAMNAAQGASSMISQLLGRNGMLTASYNKMNQFAQDAYSSAMNMDSNIGSIIGNASQLQNASNELYSMNASDPNSLIGQYISSVKAIDPNRYVSMAASDTQASYENVKGQLERNMSRQGMSAGAQASSLQKNWGIALASALAGAKTKARQQGITERLNALKESVGMANEMQKQATDQQSTAAQLYAQQAEALTKAGQMTQAAAEGFLNGLKEYNNSVNLQINAAQIFTDAQRIAAELYANIASVYGGVHQQNLERLYNR